MFHVALHFLVPLVIALLFYRERWRRSWLLMLVGLVIDLDHLLADPVYDPGRCSLGFHPLHTFGPMLLYTALLAHRKTRLLGIGLWIHILLDGIDCQVTNGIWYTP